MGAGARSRCLPKHAHAISLCLVATVSDGSHFQLLRQHLGRRLKQQVLARDGTLIIRPD